jgi:hypothetical protein
MKLPATSGLRLRLIALVLAAVAPFVFLIAMVARQHRFNERSAAEETALDAAELPVQVRKVLDAAA